MRLISALFAVFFLGVCASAHATEGALRFELQQLAERQLNARLLSHRGIGRVCPLGKSILRTHEADAAEILEYLLSKDVSIWDSRVTDAVSLARAQLVALKIVSPDTPLHDVLQWSRTHLEGSGDTIRCPKGLKKIITGVGNWLAGDPVGDWQRIAPVALQGLVEMLADDLGEHDMGALPAAGALLEIVAGLEAQ